MKLFIAPHNDDETLFGAFTLIEKNPLVVVVTDSWKQFVRDGSITADRRWAETLKAMQILGCPAMRLGIRDDAIDEWTVREKLNRFKGFEQVFAPALQGGNPDHDLVSKVATDLFGDKVVYYATYSASDLYTTGSHEITPSAIQLELKGQAMACYESQLNYPPTAPHFEAVKGKSEWYI